MPDADVIADTSTTLQVLLRGALTGLVVPGSVVVDEPREANGPPASSMLYIYLFDALEDPGTRNRPTVREVVDSEVILKKPPMAILLRYLLIPYARDRISEHKVLGKVMQTLYDEAILSGTQLQGGLAGTAESLKVTLIPMTLEDRTRVWHAVQKPFKLAATYEVRVIHLDSTRSQRVRQVKTRILTGTTEES